MSSPLFVGRARELEALEAALAAAREGEASTVLVSGEAGVGKTRLLAEFAERASAGGARVLIGNCIELGDGELPHAPLAAILRQLELELDPEALAAVLGPARGVLDPAAPNNQASRLDLVLALLGRLGELAPAVVAIEDLHWADRSTRDLLAFLIRSLRRERIVLVATYRSDELHRRHPLRAFLAAQAGGVERIELARFDEDELDAARHGDPRRAARARAGRAVAGALGGQRVPGRGAARRRRERAAGDAARGAAGPRRAVVGCSAGRCCASPHAPERACRTACSRRRRGCRSSSWRTRCPRRSPATCSCAAAATPTPFATRCCARPSMRTSCRASAPGSTPRSRGRSTDAPDLASGGAAVAAAELAHHWKAAHALAEALSASVDGRPRRRRIAAFPEAQRHFEYALDVWDRVEDAEERAGMDRIDLTRRAVDAAHLAADRERAIALARDAAARLDADRDPVRYALVHERLGRYLWAVGRNDEAARPTARPSPRCPPIRPAPNARGSSRARGRSSCSGARGRAAIVRCEEALAVARAVGARAEEGQALNTLGTCRAGFGEHEAGEASVREALAIALELQLPDDIGRAYVNLSDCVDEAGRIDEAAQLALDGLRGRPVAGTRRRPPRDAAERGGASHSPHRALGRGGAAR